MGPNQTLTFPSGVTYNQHKLYFANEPYNRAFGMIDLNSGKIMGEFLYPMFIDQSIIEALVPDNNGRIGPDPFLVGALRSPQNAKDPLYAFFEKGTNGQTTLRLNLYHARSFASYCFPQPSLLTNQCWIAPSGANLNIFTKIQAAHLADPANPGPALLGDNRTFKIGRAHV